MDIQESRDAIQKIDKQLVNLFTQRMEAVRQVAAYKRERGLPIEDTAQEARVLAACEAQVPDDDLRAYSTQFMQATMDISKRWQHRLLDGMHVAYSGVEGAFAYIAAQRIFPDATLIRHTSFEEAYNAVAAGECDVAVLPIENSHAGEVGQVTDLMFSGSLHVNGVYDLPVVHNLLGVPGAKLSDIKKVVSHSQALAQCQAYLAVHNFEIEAVANTALAAQQVAASGDTSVAAIASNETAALYGLDILDHDINEDKSNVTRFAVLSRTENLQAKKHEAGGFILMFTVKDEAGGLAKAINIISSYGFNMRVLRSRPMKGLAWHYYFYVEAEGDDTSEEGRRMLAALAAACPSVKVVGRYHTNNNVLE